MTHLPRRPARVKPPLRGRAATKHYRGNFASINSVRRPLSPYGSAPLPSRRDPLCSPPVEVKPPQDMIPPETQIPDDNLDNSPDTDQGTFYKRWGQSLRSLDQPWRWLITFVLIFGSLLLLNQLF